MIYIVQFLDFAHKGALAGQRGTEGGTFPTIRRGVTVTRCGWFRVAMLALRLSGGAVNACGLVPRQCPMAKKKSLDTMSNPLFYLVALQGLEPRTRGL